MARKTKATRKATGPADEYQAFRARLCDSLELIASAFAAMARAQVTTAEATTETVAMMRKLVERAEKRGLL